MPVRLLALRNAVWHKSSRSSTSNSCVEVAVTSDVVGVRDTKDRGGGVLTFGPRAWAAFLESLKS